MQRWLGDLEKNIDIRRERKRERGRGETCQGMN